MLIFKRYCGVHSVTHFVVQANEQPRTKTFRFTPAFFPSGELVYLVLLNLSFIFDPRSLPPTSISDGYCTRHNCSNKTMFDCNRTPFSRCVDMGTGFCVLFRCSVIKKVNNCNLCEADNE